MKYALFPILLVVQIILPGIFAPIGFLIFLAFSFNRATLPLAFAAGIAADAMHLTPFGIFAVIFTVAAALSAEYAVRFFSTRTVASTIPIAILWCALAIIPIAWGALDRFAVLLVLNSVLAFGIFLIVSRLHDTDLQTTLF